MNDQVEYGTSTSYTRMSPNIFECKSARVGMVSTL